MNLLIKIIVTALLVVILSHFMPGVRIAGFTTALIVAVVLGLLNIFIKPIIVFFTLPVTVLTLGLFLLVINALMVLLCTKIVGGFAVDGFITAFIFSIVLSVLQSAMNLILGVKK
ncbi:phage holin family protein [Flavobacterium turcicum]|uniref:Phage holin family protein n=1 Tax=Flavobacterium turcicum TaxID=2764718 RepID=A0ABR7JD09_9FLAO|nr:phage holin family protein [Flavobacterium turcicum]MBC5862393.1 phage holin family protein [Flavobacterium turcicum]NHL01124.1 phage holin family protein [Flavobacterium turcicum]